MDGFKSYLLSRYVANDKKAVFYLYWVEQFYKFSDKNPMDDVTTDGIDGYLKHLSKRRRLAGKTGRRIN